MHQAQWKPSVREFERGRGDAVGKYPWFSYPTSCSEQVQSQQDAQGLVEFLTSPRVESCQPFWAPATVSDHLSGTKFFSFILSGCPIDWLFCLKHTVFFSFCSSNTTFWILFFKALPQSTWWRNYEAYRKAREITDVCHLWRLPAWPPVAHRLGFPL